MFAVISCGRKRVRITREMNTGELTPEYFKDLPPAWYQIVLIGEIPKDKKFHDGLSALYMFWDGKELTLREA